jgi:hypothetical protein
LVVNVTGAALAVPPKPTTAVTGAAAFNNDARLLATATALLFEATEDPR